MMSIEDPSSSQSPKATPPSSSSRQSPPDLPPEPASTETPAGSTGVRAPLSRSQAQSKSLDELRRLAKASGVTGYSRMKKNQLVRALSSSGPRRSVGVEKDKPGPRVRPGATDPVDKVARVTPELVKAKLSYAGDITHGLGVSYFGLDTPEAKKHLSNDLTRDLFRFTNDELDAIAPALASLANRHAVVSRVVEQSDEGVIALVVARSAVRNFTDLRAAAAMLEVYAPAPPPEGGDGGLEKEAQDVPGESRAGAGAGPAGGREAGG